MDGKNDGITGNSKVIASCKTSSRVGASTRTDTPLGKKKKKKMLSTNRVLHLEKGLSFSLWLQHVCHFFSGPPHKARLDKHIYLTSCDNLKKLCQKDAGLLCLG